MPSQIGASTSSSSSPGQSRRWRHVEEEDIKIEGLRARDAKNKGGTMVKVDID